MRLLTPEIEFTQGAKYSNKNNSNKRDSGAHGKSGAVPMASGQKSIMAAFARTTSMTSSSSSSASSYASVVSTASRSAASVYGGMAAKAAPALPQPWGLAGGSLGSLVEGKGKMEEKEEGFQTGYTLTIPVPVPKAAAPIQEAPPPAPASAPPAAASPPRTHSQNSSQSQSSSSKKRQPLLDRTNRAPDPQEVVDLADSPQKKKKEEGKGEECKVIDMVSPGARPSPKTKAKAEPRGGGGGVKRKAGTHEDGVKIVKTSKSAKGNTGKTLKMMNISAFFSRPK